MDSFSSRVLKTWAPKPKSRQVQPYLWKQGNEYTYAPSPADLWVCAPESLHTCELPDELALPAGKDESSECPQAQDRWLYVRVEELVFPGERKRYPEGRWIYIIRSSDKKPMIEAQAIKWSLEDNESSDDADDQMSGEARDLWRILLEPDPGQEPDQRELATGLTPPVAQLAADKYRFFLSPVRLSARAFKHVLDNLEDVGVEEDLSNEQFNVTVAAPDPFAWAEDAYDRFFMPAVEDRDTFRSNEKVQSAEYLHQVFTAWKDVKKPDGGADALEIADYVDQAELDTFRSEFDTHSTDLDFEADRAGAYLAAWLHSPSVRAAEIAGQDDTGFGLDRTAAMWGYIARDLQRTEPTRQFADTIVRDTERFIWTHVFAGSENENADNPWTKSTGPGARTGIATSPPRDAKFWVGQANAISSILTGFIPSFLKYRPAMNLNDYTKIARGLEDEVGKTLYWLGMLEKDGWKAVRNSIMGIEGRGTPRIDKYWWGRETGPGRVHIKSFLNKDYMAARTELDGVNAERLKMMQELEEIDGTRYSRAMKWFGTAKTFVDVPVNLWALYVDGAALSKAMDYHQQISADQVAGLVKGLMEVIGAIAGVLQFAAEKEMIKTVTATTLAKVGAGLAIAVNLIEVWSKTNETIGEWKRADWGAMVGKGLGVMAAVCGVAAGIVLYATAAGSIAPGVGNVVGLIIGGIAAGLAIAGAWVYTAFKKTEYQQVVRSSCFSNETWNIELAWAPYKSMQRDKNPKHQAANINALLSQFSVKVENSGYPNRAPESTLIIEPGMISPDDVIEIVLWQKYKTVDNIIMWDEYTQYEAFVKAFPKTETFEHPKYAKGIAYQMVMQSTKMSRDAKTNQLSLRVGLKPVAVYQKKADTGALEAITPESMQYWSHEVESSTALIRIRRGEDSPDIPVGIHKWLRVDTVSLGSGGSLSSLSTGDLHTQYISDGSPPPPPTIRAAPASGARLPATGFR